MEKKLSSENNQLSSEQILGLLPHRYPFALVDKVIENIPGERAVAVKNVTLNEPQFQGHFPERPLMPGVLIVESMAQVGGIIVTQMPDLPKGLFVFAGINNVKFRKPVVPGDQLIISFPKQLKNKVNFLAMRPTKHLKNVILYRLKFEP